MKIGIGYDSHRFKVGRKLKLGAIEIPSEKGLLGHSDADALIHAIIDAVLGAAALGDIGSHFPDSDAKWKDADSSFLLKLVVDEVKNAGYSIVNIDSVIITEKPKLAPYILPMRTRLAHILGIDVSAISIKGKTNEKMGSIGSGDGLAVHAVCLLDSIIQGKKGMLKGNLKDAGVIEQMHPRFKAAFDFLRRPDLALLEDGKYEIIPGGECYASIEKVSLREPSAARCEAHGKYIDIHLPLSRVETIGLSPVPKEVLEGAFADGSDTVFYDTKCELVDVDVGEFIVFFPKEDGHTPCLYRETGGEIRKVIVKILK